MRKAHLAAARPLVVFLLVTAPVLSEEPPGAPPPPEVSATEIDAFLEAWGKRSQEIRSLALRFRQEKKLRILRRPRVSEGDLVYADRKLSVIVRGRDGAIESEILMKDGELKIHYPRLKRVEIVGVGGGSGPPVGAGPAIPFFADDPRNLRRDFEVSLVPSGAKGKVSEKGKEERTLRLIPKDPKSPVKRIEMTFRGLDFSEYLQVDANGDEARMSITSSQMNPEVPPGRFELEVAEGTTYIRLDGK